MGFFLAHNAIFSELLIRKHPFFGEPVALFMCAPVISSVRLDSGTDRSFSRLEIGKRLTKCLRQASGRLSGWVAGMVVAGIVSG